VKENQKMLQECKKREKDDLYYNERWKCACSKGTCVQIQGEALFRQMNHRALLNHPDRHYLQYVREQSI
jgi:hypothetical protein